MQKKHNVLWIMLLIPMLLFVASSCGPDYYLEEVTVEDIAVDFQPLIEKPRIILTINDKGRKLTIISLDASPKEISLARSIQKGDKVSLSVDRDRRTGSLFFKDIAIISKAHKVPEVPKAPEKKKGFWD
jgi:hypothetical protein